MMKKLMILSLVLAISAISSAAFSPVDPVMPGEKITVAFYAPEDVAGVSIRLITDTAIPSGAISNVFLHENLTVGRKVGDGLVADGSGTLLSTSGADGIGGAFNPFGGAKVASGELVFSFDVAVSSEAVAGDYLIQFEQGTWKNAQNVVSQLGTVAYSVVPEPMTMGLLGLGALFLRRRK